MKLRKILGLILIGMYLSCTSVQAAAIEGRHEATEVSIKITRGCKNILLCFLEIPQQIFKTGREDGAGAAASVGLCKGLLMTPVRFVSGVLDVATCFNEHDWEADMTLD